MSYTHPRRGATREWKAAYDTQVAAMSNADLLEEVTRSANADDYDGDFTAQGVYERDTSLAELTRRLREIGYLPPEPAVPGTPPRQVSSDTLHSV